MTGSTASKSGQEDEARGFDPEAMLAHLQPERVRVVLSMAGLSLLAKELIESCVVDPVKSFFSTEFSDKLEPVASERYKEEVLARHRFEVDACLAWLIDMNALTSDDAATIARVRDLRNVLSHELQSLVLDPYFAADYQALFDFAAVIRRLGVFWGRVAVGCDEAYDGQDIRDEDIDSGVSILYQVVLRAFAGLVEQADVGARAE